MYKSEKKSLSFNECSEELTVLKKSEDTLWLKEPDKFALQYTLKDLDQAYQNFFREIKKGNKGQGFPKFKSKKNNRRKYRTAYTNNNIEVLEKHIKLPKLGKVKARIHRPIEGKIVNATIEQTPSGKYFVSVCCSEVPVSILEESNNNIGLDLGLKELMVDSNGNKYENLKPYCQLEKKLGKEQKRLSRKEKQSNNYYRQRKKVGRLHERIRNIRVDYLHKLSHKIINDNQVICLENLNVNGMLKNHKLAKHISDSSWYELKRQLEYKAYWYGRSIVAIDRFYASSKLCHKCKYKYEDLDLSIRYWTCPVCHTEHDRDINAAINIREEGLRIYNGQELAGGRLPEEEVTLPGRVEACDFSCG